MVSRVVLPALAAAVAPALALAMALACGGPAGGEAPLPSSGRPEMVTLLAATNACLGDQRREAVLPTADAWAEWHAAATCGGGAPLPAVSKRSVVLAVSDVPGPSGCHGVRIADVQVRADGGLSVLVRRYVPRRGELCTAQVVHPAHAVAVAATLGGGSGPVTWTWETAEGPPPAAAP